MIDRATTLFEVFFFVHILPTSPLSELRHEFKIKREGSRLLKRYSLNIPLNCKLLVATVCVMKLNADGKMDVSNSGPQTPHQRRSDRGSDDRWETYLYESHKHSVANDRRLMQITILFLTFYLLIFLDYFYNILSS